VQKVEVLPGSFRLRRADLEAVAAGRRIYRNEAGPEFNDTPQRLGASSHRDSSLVAA